MPFPPDALRLGVAPCYVPGMTPGAGAAAGRFENVVLTGFMGTGKSAVGRTLARRLGFVFVDADDLVRAQAGRDIPALFEEEGEAGFRKRERSAIASLAGRDGIVLSTGGGAMTDPENVSVLRKLGPIVLLRASPETILRRVGGGGDRPMLGPARTPESRLRRIRELLEARREAYARADVAVDTDRLGVAEAAAAVVEALERLPDRRGRPAGG